VLRRVERINVYKGGLFRKRATVWIGGKPLIQVPWDAYRRATEQQRMHPVRIGRVGERNYWLFRDRWYSENDDLPVEAVNALLLDRERRKARQIDRAMLLTQEQDDVVATPRAAIPDDVKAFVWQRDKGRCAQCGSNKLLEFDHIVPLAMGGANTARNIQLLCESCNREKGGNLT
jgi:HNH endonuclease